MRHSIQPPARSRGLLLPSIMTLAFWRWRETWSLQVIATLGIIAAIIVTCTVPMFSDVMNTASLRSALRTNPDSAEIEVNTGSLGLSSAINQNIEAQFDDLLKANLGSLAQKQQRSIISSDYFFDKAKKDQLSLTMVGTQAERITPYLGKLQGRAPRLTAHPENSIEILLSEKSAKLLNLKLGSTLQLVNNYYLTSPVSDVPRKNVAPLTAHVVGIFTIDAKASAYWHGDNFEPLPFVQNKITQYGYTFLVANDSLLTFADKLNKSKKVDTTYSASYGYTIRQFYTLDTARIANQDLSRLITQLANLQHEHDAQYGDLNTIQFSSTPPFPYLQRANLSSYLFGTEDHPGNLERVQSRLELARVPTLILSLQIILLILFFVSLMTSLLIDRQTDSIAILRSRGASSGQVFGAQLAQFITLSFIALLIGIPAAFGTVYGLTYKTLLPAQQDALNILTTDRLAVIQQSLWYALGIVLVTLLTMSISLLLASRMDVLAIRRASGRPQKPAIWQRLNLDIIAGLFALGGYVVSLYVASLDKTAQGDSSLLVSTPLSIIAPFFLIIGSMFLFLRIFPLLLRLVAGLLSRGRGAVSMLALAQLSRAPRHSMRMTMLLAIAISFALFTLIYNDTQTQHVRDLSTYQVGADFSGEYPGYTKNIDPKKIITQYQNIPGVISASAGFVAKGQAAKSGSTLSIRAVETQTFLHTINWPTLQEQQQAEKVFAKLTSARATALATKRVPVIIDTVTANNTLLREGSTLTMRVSGLNLNEVNALVVGVIPYIPTTNRVSNSLNATATGGVILDYTTYVEFYQKLQKDSKQTFIMLDSPPINQVWLHTRDDEASLASIHTMLKKPSLQLRNLLDRREILNSLTTDPLYLVLTGILSIGTIVTVVLAFIGDLLASWISAQTRRVNFAILRAIGTTPQEVVRLLSWEQAIIYITGLLLGIAFGWLLAISVIPALTFTNLNSDVTPEQLYALQTAFPVHLSVPSSLIFALFALVGIYIIALLLMIRLVTRPSINQMIRLNED